MPKVIGLAGTMGSGKAVVKDYLMKKYNCYYVSLSSIIRAEFERRKTGFSRKTLQDQGNEMRKKYGNGIFAKLSISYLPRDKELIIVDGIRNPGEIEYLKKEFGNKFFMIGIDAPQKIRFERIVKRARPSDPKTWEDFVVLDERDQGINEPAHGQQTKACLDLADFLLSTEGSEQEIETKLNEISSKIMG